MSGGHLWIPIHSVELGFPFSWGSYSASAAAAAASARWAVSSSRTRPAWSRTRCSAPSGNTSSRASTASARRWSPVRRCHHFVYLWRIVGIAWISRLIIISSSLSLHNEAATRSPKNEQRTTRMFELISSRASVLESRKSSTVIKGHTKFCSLSRSRRWYAEKMCPRHNFRNWFTIWIYW